METAGRLVDDDELREALKERGLGTPATRASIIETLLARGYIERDAKSLLATDLGRFLIALVRDPELRSSELTGAWEAKFRQIEKGRLEAGGFMREVVDYVGRLVAPEPPLNTEAWGTCPRCGQAVIEGSRGWGCSAWRQGCGFVLWRDQQGHSLSSEQARQLLQRRLLFEAVTLTDESDAERTKMLYLSSQGGVIEIDPPQPAARNTGSGGKKRGASRSTKTLGGKRTAKSSKGRKASRKTASSAKRSRKPKGRQADELPAQQAVSDSSALGACPICGSEVREQSKSFGCSAWRDGCKFAIWKTIAGKKITRRMAETLLRTGKTALLKGFTSKAGNSFNATLRLDDGEVRFDFSGEE
jgi:DNA topoisomerase-3